MPVERKKRCGGFLESKRTPTPKLSLPYCYCYLPTLGFKNDAAWKYLAGIMFIEWACLLPSKNTHEIFISSRSKCLGSFCCQVQAVSVCWERLGCRSIGVARMQEHWCRKRAFCCRAACNSSHPAASVTSDITCSGLGRMGI